MTMLAESLADTDNWADAWDQEHRPTPAAVADRRRTRETLRAQDRRVLERITPNLWQTVLRIAGEPYGTLPPELRPYRARPIAITSMRWPNARWWLVYDQHGARLRYATHRWHVAVALSRALADEVREEHATWTE